MRDAVVSVAATLPVFLFWMTAGREISPQYFAVWFVASVFAMNALAKAFWHSHFWLKRVAWLYLLSAAAIAIAISVFMSDGSILGQWTVPTIIALGISYAIMHYMLGPRFEDDVGPPIS